MKNLAKFCSKTSQNRGFTGDRTQQCRSFVARLVRLTRLTRLLRSFPELMIIVSSGMFKERVEKTWLGIGVGLFLVLSIFFPKHGLKKVIFEICFFFLFGRTELIHNIPCQVTIICQNQVHGLFFEGCRDKDIMEDMIG